MKRSDSLGLFLVLLVALGGATWIASQDRRRAREADAAGEGGQAHFAPDPSARRVPVRFEVQREPEASTGEGWRRLNRDAIALLEAEDFESAIAAFERCVEGAPEEAVFRSNLAEALARYAARRYEQRDGRDAAIALLERATQLAPERKELADLLAQWRKVAASEKDFWSDESEHFLLSYDGERRELLHRAQGLLLTELESAYLEFGELFGRFPVEAGRPKIQVSLYRREEFADLTGIGHWAGGVFDGALRLPVEDLEKERSELVRVLRHELVHAFVAEVGGREVPGWLNEGLAQWLEQVSPAERDRRVAEARRALAPDTLFDLDRLAGSFVRWTDLGALRRAYAQSLAVVAHVAGHYGERLVFELVEGCAAGRSCAATFQARTGVAFATVLEDLARGL